MRAINIPASAITQIVYCVSPILEAPINTSTRETAPVIPVPKARRRKVRAATSRFNCICLVSEEPSMIQAL